MTTAQQTEILAMLRESFEAERREESTTRPHDGEHERYLLALLSPDLCNEITGYPASREDAGLVLHCDGVWEENVAWISDAEHAVSEECGYPVKAVECHDDGVWHWRFRPKNA